MFSSGVDVSVLITPVVELIVKPVVEAKVPLPGSPTTVGAAVLPPSSQKEVAE